MVRESGLRRIGLVVGFAFLPWLGANAYAASDEWEDDDTASTASWIGVDGPRQNHSFHDAGDDDYCDDDWAMFYAFAGESISIKTEVGSGSTADTYIEIYDSDGTSLLGSDDDSGGLDLTSFYTLNVSSPLVEGFYYVRVTASPWASSPVYGDTATYRLHVWKEVGGYGPGDILGIVKDAVTLAPIPNATVILADFGNLITAANGSGEFEFRTLPPTKTITVRASAPGYGHESTVVVIESGDNLVELLLTVSSQPPVADFSGTPITGTAPLNVQFSDTSNPGSSPITAWFWSFGDGQNSEQPSPSHTYEEAGEYTVSLTVTTAVGSDAATKVEYIGVDAAIVPPTADFLASPLRGVAPLIVDFTDMSWSGNEQITAWSWDFGDGSGSIDMNPLHRFEESGEYTVSLRVTTPAGSHTATRTAYIKVTAEGENEIPIAWGSGMALLGMGLALTGIAAISQQNGQKHE